MRGKGTSGMGRPRQAQDHPRLCGEKHFSRRCRLWTAGSPPPMRGKAAEEIRTSKQRRDHPRLCGEKYSPAFRLAFLLGSPPPMRGKADDISNYYLKLRITPAYAGKRDAVFPALDCVEDHPRLCGEKWFPRSKRTSLSGSPPPMRGKAQRAFHGIVTIRITPAYAGKRIKKIWNNVKT